MTDAGSGGDEQPKGGEIASVKWWQGFLGQIQNRFMLRRWESDRTYSADVEYKSVITTLSNFRSLILHHAFLEKLAQIHYKYMHALSMSFYSK